jgi:exopolyphosphatase/guanosine-5'-triphosphate,3'-diphosphate pyrophosphatase
VGPQAPVSGGSGRTLGVIDIGSNSGRVLVARVRGAAHLDVLGDARSPLRLVRDVARAGSLSSETIERTLGIVRGFVAVAASSGAESTVAVATAAVREANNGEELIQRTRHELGIPVDIANGEEEARYGFLGAVHAIPMQDGIVLDVGGGSLQLIHFRGRRLQRSWSLPLGALRLSDRFLKSDPPTRGEMRALRDHVFTTLEKAGIRPLQPGERMIGTGGSIRNLGKIDRRMLSEYPITRLHGYVVDRRRVDGIVSLLSGSSASSRVEIPGLNADRADSIVGGALVVQGVMDRLRAQELTVAGYGMREGIALGCVTDQAASVEAVQAVATAALGSHFTVYDTLRAAQRTALIRRLMARLLPDISDEVMLAATAAARLLDIGASIDHYRRHAHSARIVCDANLDGFTHHTLALIAAAIYAVGEHEATVKPYMPLLGPADQPIVEKIAAGVALADALVLYGSVDPETIDLERSNGHVVLATPVLDSWPLEAPTRRAERAFGASITRLGESVGVG